MSRSRTTVLALLVVLLTFAAGFLGGFATHRALRRHHQIPTASARLMARHLDFRLDLDDAQRAKIEEILARRQQRIEAAYSGVRPRVHAEIDAANAEIARVLTPEQRSKFERLKIHLVHRRHGPGRSRH